MLKEKPNERRKKYGRPHTYVNAPNYQTPHAFSTLATIMGNGLFRATTNCLPCAGSSTAGHASVVVTSEPYHEGVGHSFFYHTDNPTTYRSISGASVSANASTHLSTALLSDTTFPIAASVFDCSTSFSSAPLHPISRFSSAPLDRGFLSGPLNPPFAPLRRTLSLQPFRTAASSLLRSLTKKQPKISVLPQSENDELISQSSNLHWAEGKAGEDRVHVIISEEQEWVFVGIYDGFNGPDATDYLLSNLYSAVQLELKGLLSEASIKHSQVLKALSRALKKTEEEYLDVADRMVNQNPELALMGSTVLLMVMKGEDVYLMNVGDSRAVVARMPDRELAGKETMFDSLVAMQLTLDHSTSIKEEVRRIRKEHPDDVSAIVNDRVKGSLRVTRAFGAGFLKKPKWNNALLEMFRIDYVGTKPYISCSPFLHHHRLGPSDKFLILSSDGLYQYFTNEDAVAKVELFIATNCDGDPAQHLVEEVLFRAAEKAGLDFHQLLEIRQGDRRQYHDDISVIVISLEGRIWRSSM